MALHDRQSEEMERRCAQTGNNRERKAAYPDRLSLIHILHIGELLDDTRGMSNSEILNYQLDKFREGDMMDVPS